MMYCCTVCRYGLLGPSGCGKTTLLNCILGQTSLDSGKIYVNAQRHSEISYMPQVLLRLNCYDLFFIVI